MFIRGAIEPPFYVKAIDMLRTAIRAREDFLYQQNLIHVDKYTTFVLDVRLENFNDDEGKGINPGNCYFQSYNFFVYQ